MKKISTDEIERNSVASKFIFGMEDI